MPLSSGRARSSFKATRGCSQMGLTFMCACNMYSKGTSTYLPSC